jgi:hypothetical protein
MSVRVTLGDDALHVAVRDHCPDQPTFRGPVAAGATGGRGLLLIDALAQRWGTTALEDGKVVWAVVGSDDESD